MVPEPLEVACIAEPQLAGALLNPLRLSILQEARQPASATEIAGRLGEPRQKINYHVRELARVGLLVPAEQRRRGNLIEQRYLATARSYVLTPEVIAPLAADAGAVADEESAAHLLALTGRVQSDVARVLGEARAQGKRLPTLSIAGEIRFVGPEQRAAFTRALRDAVARVVATHTSPRHGSEDHQPPGRLYRLVLGCYPAPPDEDESHESDSNPGGQS